MKPHVKVRRPPRGDEAGGGAPGDAEIIGRVVAGNLGALGLLYDRHQAEVRRHVLRCTVHCDEADDIVHDVFLTIPRAGATFDGRSSALPFLFGIADQVMRERRRKRARLLRVLSAFGQTLSRFASRTPEDATSDARDLEHLGHAIAALSEEKRVVLLMVEREGLSGEEVATELGIPVATVWTRLHYARADVRRVVEKRRRR
jgi:RNA polymerase sigma-70 factor (ECF subfamily)